jgi:UDP-N-acetylmuramate dehydrogenase
MNNLSVKQFLTDNKIAFREEELLSKHTTFKIGGKADFFVMPETTEEAVKVCAFSKENERPLTVIGKGSNLLVSDDGVEGIVMSLSQLNNIELLDTGTVRAGAGAALTNLCNFALKEGLSGLEFAFGIPGSVGGAVFMNAGAYGGEISHCISSATVLTLNGEIKTIKKEEMALGYRTSCFKTESTIILSADFVLNPANKKEIKAAMDDYMTRRRDKQPLEYPSAGSTFKRPEGHFAGALIENSGLKGFGVGGAEVSVKHAGFLINKNNATCRDVLDLISSVQKKVYERFEVELEPEVIFIGREMK